MGCTRKQLKILEISAQKFCVCRLGSEEQVVGYVSMGQQDAAAQAMVGTEDHTEGGVLVWKTRQGVTRAIKLARWGERNPIHAANIESNIKSSVMEGSSIRHYLCG